METLTPAERRGALVIVLLLALGALHDLWRAGSPRPATVPGVVGIGTPAAGESPRGSGPGAADLPGSGVGRAEPGRRREPIDLNRASAQELEALPGIGPVLAARIVSRRERHGPFRSGEELLAVRGIGPRLLERLRPHVRVGAVEGPGAPGRADSTAGGR